METLKQQLNKNKEELWAEVMEDYVITAELGHLAKDQTKHKEEMRGHFKKLQNWHTSSISSIIKLLIQEEEKEKRYELGSGARISPNEKEWNEAKQDSINRLKELLKLIEE